MRNTNFNRNGYQGRNNGPDAGTYWGQLGFNPKWIKTGADTSMVEFADNAGKFMAENNLSNSQIRNIYGEVKRIQMGRFDRCRTSFILLKPKVAYAQGRDKNNKGLSLFKLFFDSCFSYVTDENTFQNFCDLFEAVLAYHKSYARN